MIKKIELINFKKHSQKKIDINSKITIISGPNGAGKTSFLEAISLFTLGNKGIFHLDNATLIKKGESSFEIKLHSEYSNYSISYNNENKKNILINNHQEKSKTLQDQIKIFGITPFLSLAFWQDNSIRRKFIDRIVLQHNSLYGNYYLNYTKAIKERNALIENGTFNSKWQNAIDPIIKENGIKLNEIRNKVFKNIFNNQNIIQEFLEDNLILEQSPSFEEQNKIFEKTLDINFIGPHKTKFSLNSQSIFNPSTGQQRKILLSFILISMKNYEEENYEKFLLLDDIFSNLDQATIKKLLLTLEKQNFQTIISNIDPMLEDNINNIIL